MIKNLSLTAALLTVVFVAVACASPPTPPSAAAPAAIPVVTTTGSEQGPSPKGIEVGDIDPKADACTDFYDHANGAWRAEHPIPEGRPRWSRRVAAHDGNARQVQALLAELAARTDWPAGSAEQLAGDHFASCMDETSLESAGLAPLAPLLAQIDQARTLSDVQRAMRRLHDLAIPVGFGTSADLDYRDPARTIVNVVAGTLGMPGRDDYVKSDPHLAELRAKYRAHVARVLTLGGMAAPKASTSAQAVVALETRLADASLDATASADPAATSHPTSFAELQKLAPHVDWKAYFAEAGLPGGELNVADPRHLQRLDAELQRGSLATWKAYLTFQLLESASPWLARPFADESFAFRERDLGGATQPRPRTERCAQSTDALLGDALGKVYAARYFPPAAKAKVQQMVHDLLDVLKEDVPRVAWMTPETRTKALAILAVYNPQIGYPDHWKDYGSLTVRRHELWANVAAAHALGVRDNRARAGKATDRDLWQLTPSSPDAYILPELDQMVLPAGFLQPPTFDLRASDAVNYGAIGIGVAHDLTHAIDASGSEVDITGRHQGWWTAADRQQFDQAAQCVVDQYESYSIEPGVHLDGKLVRSEAIGDLAGVRLSFQALARARERHPVPTIDGFTPEQQFFLSYGQFRGDEIRLEAQRKMVKSDIHPPSRFRIDGPLASSPDFQQAFACKPVARPCSVW